VKRAEHELRIVGGAWRSRRLRFSAARGLRPTPDRLRETLFNWLGPWIVGRRVLDLYAGSGALGIEALSRGAREAVFVERSAAVAAALRENLARLGVGTDSSFPRKRESSSTPRLPDDKDAGAPAARIECADALEWLGARSDQAKASRPSPFPLAREGRDEGNGREAGEDQRLHPHPKPLPSRERKSEFDLVFVDPPWASDLAPETLALLATGPLLAPDHRVYLERPVNAGERSGIAGNNSPDWEVLKNARVGSAHGILLRLSRAAFGGKRQRP
jgi:16S rRNA G966 N2-methylase RsmD